MPKEARIYVGKSEKFKVQHGGHTKKVVDNKTTNEKGANAGVFKTVKVLPKEGKAQETIKGDQSMQIHGIVHSITSWTA